MHASLMIAARLRLAARDALLDRIETADKIGEQSKDIVRDASAGRVLCDDERTADLRHKRVRIAKLVSAGNHFNQCQHEILSGKAPPSAEMTVSAVLRSSF